MKSIACVIFLLLLWAPCSFPNKFHSMMTALIRQIHKPDNDIPLLCCCLLQEGAHMLHSMQWLLRRAFLVSRLGGKQFYIHIQMTRGCGANDNDWKRHKVIDDCFHTITMATLLVIWRTIRRQIVFLQRLTVCVISKYMHNNTNNNKHGNYWQWCEFEWLQSDSCARERFFVASYSTIPLPWYSKPIFGYESKRTIHQMCHFSKSIFHNRT